MKSGSKQRIKPPLASFFCAPFGEKTISDFVGFYYSLGIFCQREKTPLNYLYQIVDRIPRISHLLFAAIDNTDHRLC